MEVIVLKLQPKINGTAFKSAPVSPKLFMTQELIDLGFGQNNQEVVN